MNANAPEKVYFSSIEDGTHYYTEAIPFEREYIEYVRKDAFVKKAKLWLAEIHRVCDITDENGYRIELRQLQARFENYMKGE